MSDTVSVQSLLAVGPDAVSARVSLGKAQKYHERLVAAIPTQGSDDDAMYRRRLRRPRYGAEGGSVVAVPVPAASRGADIVAAALARAEEARATFAETLALSADAARLKESIFAGNQASGASRVMAEMRLWQQRLAFAEQAKSAMEQSVNAVPLSTVVADSTGLAIRLEEASMAALAGNSAVQLQVRWQSSEEIAQMRQEARQALNALDDELRRANATYLVDVLVSPFGAAALGL